MIKRLLLAAALLLPALAPKAEATCTQLQSGMMLYEPSIGDSFAVWASCIRTMIEQVNSSATYTTSSTTTAFNLPEIYVSRIGGRSTGAPYIRVSSSVVQDAGFYFMTLGTMTVQGNAFSVGTSTFVVTGGKVGVGGAVSPLVEKLEVLGNIHAGSQSSGNAVIRNSVHDPANANYSFWANPGDGMYETANGILAWATSGLQRMNLNSSGALGMVSTAGNTRMTITGSESQNVIATSAGVPLLINTAAGGGTDIADTGSTFLSVRGGKVGVGITSPDTALHVSTTSSLVAKFERTGSAGGSVQLFSDATHLAQVGYSFTPNSMTMGPFGHTTGLTIDTAGTVLTEVGAIVGGTLTVNGSAMHVGTGAVIMDVVNGRIGLGTPAQATFSLVTSSSIKANSNTLTASYQNFDLISPSVSATLFGSQSTSGIDIGANAGGNINMLSSKFNVGSVTFTVTNGQIGMGSSPSQNAVRTEIRMKPNTGSVGMMMGDVTANASSYFQFTDNVSYNMGAGTDGDGSFNLYANRNNTTAGTRIFTVSQAGATSLTGSVSGTTATFANVVGVNGGANLGYTNTTPLTVKSDASGRGIRMGTTDFNNTSAGSGLVIDFGNGSGNVRSSIQAITGGSNLDGSLILNANGGNVGINTNTPDYKLHMATTTGQFIHMQQTGNGDNWYLTGDSAPGFHIGFTTAGNHIQLNRSNTNVYLALGGGAGVNTSSVQNALSVKSVIGLQSASGNDRMTLTGSESENLISSLAGIPMRIDTPATGVVKVYSNGDGITVNNGSVGIKLTNPTNPLDVLGPISFRRSSDSTRVSTMTMENGNMEFQASETGSANMVFKTAGTERARFTNAGLLGLGTLQPSSKMAIRHLGFTSLGRLTNAHLYLDNSGNEGELSQIAMGYSNNSNATFAPAVIYSTQNDTSGFTNAELGFATRNLTTDTAPIERMRIKANGSVQIGPFTSDRGIKLNVRSDTDGNRFAVSRTADNVEALYIRVDSLTPSIISNNADIKISTINANTGEAAGGITLKNTSAFVGILNTNPGTALDVGGTIRQSTVLNCGGGVTTDANGGFTGCNVSAGTGDATRNGENTWTSSNTWTAASTHTVRGFTNLTVGISSQVISGVSSSAIGIGGSGLAAMHCMIAFTQSATNSSEIYFRVNGDSGSNYRHYNTNPNTSGGSGTGTDTEIIAVVSGATQLGGQAVTATLDFFQGALTSSMTFVGAAQYVDSTNNFRNGNFSGQWNGGTTANTLTWFTTSGTMTGYQKCERNSY